MDSLTSDAALISVQLQQLLMEFAHELDINKGHDIGQFYAEDGAFLVGNHAYRGRDQIQSFYRDRPTRTDAEQAGVRTGRHLYVNQRVAVQDDGHATLYFMCVHYAAAGTPPIPGLTGPAVVADCRMTFRRDAARNWRIVEFSSAPIFLGGDQALNKLLVKT